MLVAEIKVKSLKSKAQQREKKHAGDINGQNSRLDMDYKNGY